MLQPGQRVRHPDRPDWAWVRCNRWIGDRVTVNFEHAGKVIVNAAVVPLEPVEDEDP